MTETQVCFLCDFPKIQTTRNVDRLSCDCPRCGKYDISLSFCTVIDSNPANRDKKLMAILSGFARERTYLGLSPVLYTSYNYLEIPNDPAVPKNIKDKMIKLLKYFNNTSEYFGQKKQLTDHLDYPITYSERQEELIGILNELIDNNYLKKTKDGYPVLTMKGIEYIQEKEKETSKTGFVAMWFTEEMHKIYDNAISKAISECGFAPVVVSRQEHNNLIDDQIIAGIKTSKFIVAELTGYRGGVYWEAGYASGLGKDVILTCQKDWFNEKQLKCGCKQEGVHFDLNHRNIIVWENTEDLYTQLKRRIEATI